MNSASFLRIALIRSARASEWGSCRSIVDGLEAAYLGFNGSNGPNYVGPGATVRVFSFRPDCFELGVLRELRAFAPDRLVLLEHGSQPAEFLRQWLAFAPELACRPCLVHAYGDFSIASPQWLSLEHALQGIPIRWLCASQASAGQVAGYLRQKAAESVLPVPFPIDQNVFFYDGERAARNRRRLGLESQDFAVLYSGRLSMQKNLPLLLGLLEQASRISARPLKLLVAGSYDEIGADHLGIRLHEGFFRNYLAEQWAQVNADSLLETRLLGQLSRAELCDAYLACDLGCSLSLHHDEDYGMAPAEALCTGLPLVLSAWGGFRDFAREFPRAVGLIEPEFWGDFAAGFASTSATELITARIQHPFTPEARMALACAAQDKLSIAGVTKKLRSILLSPEQAVARFTGFTPLFAETAREMKHFGRYAREGFGDEAYRAQYASYARALGEKSTQRGGRAP